MTETAEDPLQIMVDEFAQEHPDLYEVAIKYFPGQDFTTWYAANAEKLSKAVLAEISRDPQYYFHAEANKEISKETNDPTITTLIQRSEL
ncbi:MAG: hypothetical protein V3V78_00295 [Candidatus Woesearchaeota archaeon]